MLATDLPFDLDLAMALLAGVASGLLIGIERGWRQRGKASGTRVAGVRTFTLIGALGSLVSLITQHVGGAVAAIVLAGLVVLLVAGFLREWKGSEAHDATTMVAAMFTLALGLLAGAGHPAFAIAGAAVATLILAMRSQAHGMLRALSREEVQAIARFAVIAAAVLPFLPDANYGPYGSWNPFRLWLVVVLISAFSIIGYVANRMIGERRGTIATALIGGAYSSTAVTAALATRLRAEERGPFSTGIALASAVMYLRVFLLTAVLAPFAAIALLWIIGPAAIVAIAVTPIAWRFETSTDAAAQHLSRKPFELLPALVFLLAAAAASLLVHWAQAEFGETGGGLSLFLAGSFDVDAAIVALSVLPAGSVSPEIAAIALGGTVAINMAFKIGIVLGNARFRAGRLAAASLSASLIVLVAVLAWHLFLLLS